ncbi:hypothetical protein HaLaN_26486 [Haematococcus lacustris]|uniref:Uncharacterized protein n=1 Tax=Haematococcus lacustris TaxID=44745 RepID=A0A6A0A6B0_HAELA|nr:hypothetical protein HaLaN_26486 [Haematococcus lacustris]
MAPVRPRGRQLPDSWWTSPARTRNKYHPSFARCMRSWLPKAGTPGWLPGTLWAVWPRLLTMPALPTWQPRLRTILDRGNALLASGGQVSGPIECGLPLAYAMEAG